MLVSVIMPVYNCEKYLQSSIQSVLSQTYSDWELLCIDDLSTDRSLEMLQKLSESDQRIKVLQHDRNKGGAAARNTGIEAATGQYLAFLDADDLWKPEKLQLQISISVAENQPFICGGYEVVTVEGDKKYSVVPPKSIEFSDLLKTSKVGCSTVLVRRDLVGDLRFPDIRKRQDYAFWLLLVQKCGRIRGIESLVTQYRLTPDSVSRNKLKVLNYQWFVYRCVLQLSFMKSAWYFGHYAMNGVWRRIKLDS